MAVLITTGDKMSFIVPANGVTFTLAELQKLVDGSIEVLRTSRGLMVVNEDGKRLALSPNRLATSYLGPMYPGDAVVGDAVLVSIEEMNEGDDDDAH
jgi:hypothetical protein